MSEYKVKFEVFEGPLDLLLYLIKKEEVDIYEVNLTKLATQFIEYIEVMRMLDLEIAGEFLVMTSTLMYIKSRELLPKEQRVSTEVEEDGEDPRWELIRQLVEYKKFKDAAAQLQNMEFTQENTYARVPAKPEFETPKGPARSELSIFDLLNAVNTILKRFGERENTREIFEDKWSVSEKIQYVRNLLLERPSVRFSELFANATSRIEVVVTFLAVLELTRLRQVVIVQSEEFGEIELAQAPQQPGPETSPKPVSIPVNQPERVEKPKPLTETLPATAHAPTMVVEVQPPAHSEQPPLDLPALPTASVSPTNPQFN
ncbi:MAG: segregation/condensation protein A [Verrucomicrobiota bacterium]